MSQGKNIISGYKSLHRFLRPSFENIQGVAAKDKLEIPKSIIDAIPSGDMYDNRTDETVFGTSYDFVELYLNYLNMEETEKEKLISNLDEKSKEQFHFYAKNLENLHRYNLHKYMAKSPAIHLDLYDSSVKGGWDSYYKITNEWLKK